jgi:hypothetical protein
MNILRKIKWFFQRFFRGWDDTELWDLDIMIADFVLPRLKKYKTIRNTYVEELGEKGWNEALDKMIFSFEHIVRDDWEMSGISTAEIIKTHEQIQEGLELFGKYFRSLWD